MQARTLATLVATTLLLTLPALAQAAPVGALKQYKLAAGSGPRYIANGSDGNRWFTESSDVRQVIGRITAAGVVSEFGPVCEFCILDDIAQGPGDVLYYTSNDPVLGRITTAGEVLDGVPTPDSDALAGTLAVHGGDVWMSDFNNDSIWRYATATGQFTQFPVPEPSDVAVDAAGTVWFTTASIDKAIGRLDPSTGAVALFPTNGFPHQLTVAPDGDVWFTVRFTPQAVGRLDPATGAVTEFPIATGGPEGIAAAADGTIWFTLTTKGSVATIDDAGVIREGKAVKGSQPFGVTVDAQGDPWYAMMSADKIGELQLR
jgi:virginiamycin B lyase